MDLELRDRVYVVTGGSRGLGLASVRELVAEGARVVVSARSTDSLEELAAMVPTDQISTVVADNADPTTPQRLIDAAQSRWGRLDGLLVSVGGPPGGTSLTATDDDWRAAFDSVFLGAVRVAREVARALQRDGSIAFVLSTSVRAPVHGLGISNGLRPGLAMVAKEMSDELGPQGIRVNTLLPGRIDTDRVRSLDASTDDPDRARASWAEKIPLGRYGRPEEFGAVAAFILSPRSSFVTGSTIPVDGGLLRGL